MFFSCIFFLAFILAYYLMPPKVKAKVTPTGALSLCLSVAASLMQSLALIGLTSLKWPESFQSTASACGVILLDFETLSVSCMMHDHLPRYIMSLSLFPVGIMWILFCHFSSSRLTRWLKQWTWTRTANTTGHFLQVGFCTMSALALQPFMCYAHPNGQRSLLKHTGIFCDTEEHVAMMLWGISMGVLALIFLGLCGWGLCCFPRWTATRSKRVEAFTFLISKFKMETWWYGLPLLLRGPLLSMCPVVATDFPPNQAALVATVLLAFLLLHIRFLPWKMPLVNLADGCIQSLVLLIVTITPTYSGSLQEQVKEFRQTVASGLLVGIALALSFLGLSVFFTILYTLAKRKRLNSEEAHFRILNLAVRPNNLRTTERMQEAGRWEALPMGSYGLSAACAHCEISRSIWWFIQIGPLKSFFILVILIISIVIKCNKPSSTIALTWGFPMT